MDHPGPSRVLENASFCKKPTVFRKSYTNISPSDDYGSILPGVLLLKRVLTASV